MFQSKNQTRKTQPKKSISTFLTTNFSQTRALGKALAESVLFYFKTKRDKALLLALVGDLGGGKTTFSQGFARGLGVKEKILSPTFVIIRKYKIKKKKTAFKFFFHIDCYRVKGPEELFSLGFNEIISNPENIVAIDWAERARKVLPKNILTLNFEFTDKDTRRIKIASGF